MVRTIETPRGEFSFHAWGPGAGPLVLMLHGFPDEPRTFEQLAATLAGRGFRAVAPYARGYNPSPPFPGDGNERESVFEILGKDAVAIAESLSPGRAAHLVGHDNGGFTVYYALTERPEFFRRAVTMTAGHPAAVFANTMKNPAQMWKSRYAFLFQVPKVSDWLAERNNFHYLRELWDRWSAPGWSVPHDHWERVREVMAHSWPVPLEHYRDMAFSGPETPIKTPLLFLSGQQDGCVEANVADGQERYFSGEFDHREIAGAGHFPHLEKPDAVLPMIANWLGQ